MGGGCVLGESETNSVDGYISHNLEHNMSITRPGWVCMGGVGGGV